MDSKGIRQSLMAKELSDLPPASVAYALDAWKRGDESHLSDYEKDRGAARVGVFFPKPAELREIAMIHAKETAEQERQKRKRESELAEERDRREHPEKYFAVTDVIQDVFKRKGMDFAVKHKASADTAVCPSCGSTLLLDGARLSSFTPEDLRRFADVLERNNDTTER